jgi:hypothetical protein
LRNSIIKNSCPERQQRISSAFAATLISFRFLRVRIPTVILRKKSKAVQRKGPLSPLESNYETVPPHYAFKTWQRGGSTQTEQRFVLTHEQKPIADSFDTNSGQ